MAYNLSQPSIDHPDATTANETFTAVSSHDYSITNDGDADLEVTLVAWMRAELPGMPYESNQSKITITVAAGDTATGTVTVKQLVTACNPGTLRLLAGTLVPNLASGPSNDVRLPVAADRS
jgi:hypothetical protein